MLNSSSLLFGILPLVIFVIIDMFFGLKSALISTVVLAILEAVLSLYLFHEVDQLTFLSLALVIILAGVSYYFKSSVFIKFQPVLFSLIIGCGFIISYLIDLPFILSMMIKYQHHVPVELQEKLHDPFFKKILSIGTLTCGMSLIIHGIFLAYAALKLSNWWWLIIRGVGFHLFLFLGMFSSLLVIRL